MVSLLLRIGKFNGQICLHWRVIRYVIGLMCLVIVKVCYVYSGIVWENWTVIMVIVLCGSTARFSSAQKLGIATGYGKCRNLRPFAGGRNGLNAFTWRFDWTPRRSLSVLALCSVCRRERKCSGSSLFVLCPTRALDGFEVCRWLACGF